MPEQPAHPSETEAPDTPPFWRQAGWRSSTAIGSLVALTLGVWSPVQLAPINLLLVLVAFPLLEEIVFRGLVQPTIARHWPYRWQQLSLANLTTSALFTLAHVASRGLSPLTLGVFIPSLLFGHAAESNRGKLAAPIAMHIAFNAAYFLPAQLVG